MNTTQSPRQSDNGGFRNTPPQHQRRDFSQDTGRGNYIYTDVEARVPKLSFDYVATAVNFIIQTMHRPEAMVAVYQQHALPWFNAHPLNGQLITYEECNRCQDELLYFLRGQLKTAPVSIAAVQGVRNRG
jgi:hypothetical protein